MREPSSAAPRLRNAARLSIGFTVFLWIIALTGWLLGIDLAQFGNLPRQSPAWAGILVGPLVHGSFSHLFANSAPLIVLGTSLLYGYPRSAFIVLPTLYLGSGILVWCFARSAYHIGASGITFGLMFFIFTIGALRWDRRAIALSMLVFFLYGGMIWGIFPNDPSVSFESHFFGAAIGVVLAFGLKQCDPPPAVKRYSWEGEEDEVD